MNPDETRELSLRPREGRRAARVGETAKPEVAPKRAAAKSERAAREPKAPRGLGRAGRGPLRVAATVLVVPAIVGTVALPAYAMLPEAMQFGGTSEYSLSVAEAQGVDVPDLVSQAPVANDSYAVTTKEEIDRQAREAAANEAAAWSAELASRAGNGAYAVYTVKAEGDDYPWWDQLPDDYGGGLSPLRYYYRECVDFVAWRLNRDAGVTSAPWKWDWSNLASGSAYAWADAWAAKGWPTSSTPVVGAVAWFPYNHVAYVQSINADGSVNIEEYNQNSDHSYHRRTIPAGEALYLYPPA
ncbi:CHAP domain-containing protein [Agromyces soli]